jgi:hypothetical protein
MYEHNEEFDNGIHTVKGATSVYIYMPHALTACIYSLT